MLNACVIDLSHHNAVADWNVVLGASVLGVIHKATQGTDTDPKYHPRMDYLRTRGDVLRGAYAFGIGGMLGADQADAFLAAVGDDATNPDFRLVLDFEGNPNGQTMSRDEAGAFLDRVRQRTGRSCAMYMNTSTANALPYVAEFSATDLWAAQYPGPPNGPTITSPNWSTWKLHQFTDGKCRLQPGVEGECDVSNFNGPDAAALRAWWRQEVAQ